MKVLLSLCITILIHLNSFAQEVPKPHRNLKNRSILNNCIFRPNESTKCKMEDVLELEPYYFEDMAICGENPDEYKLIETENESKIKKELNKNNTKRLNEQSKWSWLQPQKKDLVILAELIGCLDKIYVQKIIAESGYRDIKTVSSFDRRREQTIRHEIDISYKLGFKYTTILFRPVDHFWIKKFHSIRHHKNDIVWISTYFENIKPINSIKYESKECWIDCKNKEYQYLSDIWPENGYGFTTPGYHEWKQIIPEKNKQVYRLFKGFCNYQGE